MTFPSGTNYSSMTFTKVDKTTFQVEVTEKNQVTSKKITDEKIAGLLEKHYGKKSNQVIFENVKNNKNNNGMFDKRGQPNFKDAVVTKQDKSWSALQTPKSTNEEDLIELAKIIKKTAKILAKDKPKVSEPNRTPEPVNAEPVQTADVSDLRTFPGDYKTMTFEKGTDTYFYVTADDKSYKIENPELAQLVKQQAKNSGQIAVEDLKTGNNLTGMFKLKGSNTAYQVSGKSARVVNSGKNELVKTQAIGSLIRKTQQYLVAGTLQSVNLEETRKEDAKALDAEKKQKAEQARKEQEEKKAANQRKQEEARRRAKLKKEEAKKAKSNSKSEEPAKKASTKEVTPPIPEKVSVDKKTSENQSGKAPETPSEPEKVNEADEPKKPATSEKVKKEPKVASNEKTTKKKGFFSRIFGAIRNLFSRLLSVFRKRK